MIEITMVRMTVRITEMTEVTIPAIANPLLPVRRMICTIPKIIATIAIGILMHIHESTIAMIPITMDAMPKPMPRGGSPEW